MSGAANKHSRHAEADAGDDNSRANAKPLSNGTHTPEERAAHLSNGTLTTPISTATLSPAVKPVSKRKTYVSRDRRGASPAGGRAAPAATAGSPTAPTAAAASASTNGSIRGRGVGMEVMLHDDELDETDRQLEAQLRAASVAAGSRAAGAKNAPFLDGNAPDGDDDGDGGNSGGEDVGGTESRGGAGPDVPQLVRRHSLSENEAERIRARFTTSQTDPSMSRTPSAARGSAGRDIGDSENDDDDDDDDDDDEAVRYRKPLRVHSMTVGRDKKRFVESGSGDLPFGTPPSRSRFTLPRGFRLSVFRKEEDKKHGGAKQVTAVKDPHKVRIFGNLNGEQEKLNEDPGDVDMYVHLVQEFLRGPVTFAFSLSQFECIRDLKDGVADEYLKEDKNLDRMAFTKAWVHLIDSSVLFQDEDPVFILAHTLAPSGPEEEHPILHVNMVLYPQVEPKPTKSTELRKKGGAFKTWGRRELSLHKGDLTYTKVGGYGKRKRIPIGKFEVQVDDRENHKLEFNVVTPGKVFQFMADNAEQKQEWIDELALQLATNMESNVVPAQTQAAAAHCAKCKTKFRWFHTKLKCIICKLYHCDKCFNKLEHMCKDDFVKSFGEPGSALRNSSADSQSTKGKGCAEGVGVRALDPAERGSNAEGQCLDLDEPGDELDFGYEALLQVTIVEARNVMPSDANGLSDPYAVIYFEGKEYKTQTIMTTLYPVWNAKFVIRPRGASHVLHIGVWDWDKMRSDDFLGMVMIPLQSLRNGRVYEGFYDLHPRPGKYGKSDEGVRGNIHLILEYRRPWQLLFKPVLPTEAEVAKARQLNVSPLEYEDPKKRPKFSPKYTGHYIDRIKGIMASLQTDSYKRSFKDIMEWKSPGRTLLYMLLYVYACIFTPAWIIPLAVPLGLLFLMITNFVEVTYFQKGLKEAKNALPPCLAAKARKKKAAEEAAAAAAAAESFSRSPSMQGARFNVTSSDAYSDSDVDGEDGDDDVFEEDDDDDQQSHRSSSGGKKKSSGYMGRLRQTSETLRKVQNKVGDFVIRIERIQSLLSWQDRQQSAILFGALLAAVIVLLAVPFRLLLLLGGVFRFFKHLIKRHKAIRLSLDVEIYVKKSSGSDALNFVNRAPLPWDSEAKALFLPEGLKKN